MANGGSGGALYGCGVELRGVCVVAVHPSDRLHSPFRGVATPSCLRDGFGFDIML